MISKEITNDLILEAINSQIKKETEKLLEEAKNELEKRVPKIVSDVLIDITGMSNFEAIKDNLIFTVKRK